MMCVQGNILIHHHFQIIVLVYNAVSETDIFIFFLKEK